MSFGVPASNCSGQRNARHTGPPPVQTALALQPAGSGALPSASGEGGLRRAHDEQGGGHGSTHHIRLVPHLDSRRSLRLDPIARATSHPEPALRTGRPSVRSDVGPSSELSHSFSRSADDFFAFPPARSLLSIDFLILSSPFPHRPSRCSQVRLAFFLSPFSFCNSSTQLVMQVFFSGGVSLRSACRAALVLRRTFPPVAFLCFGVRGRECLQHSALPPSIFPVPLRLSVVDP
ncbi:hypothetical protein K438DRAFT_1840997 [Mycena galopus ATCC 62051]|nr:hypothetical protein K438DRAFT_1840965 [Mycena galopus ATCC 62051]KAF8181377.1 hypothetical protein K438DRAFT_1840997 [Mycena galopus ATCC 62051]